MKLIKLIKLTNSIDPVKKIDSENNDDGASGNDDVTNLTDDVISVQDDVLRLQGPLEELHLVSMF
jgi:hypothetical protein